MNDKIKNPSRREFLKAGAMAGIGTALAGLNLSSPAEAGGSGEARSQFKVAPIDPVRVVTNRSSGKMGYRLAEAAWARGANVVLVSGPVTLQPPIGVRLRSVETTGDLETAVAEELPRADVLIMAAAPAVELNQAVMLEEEDAHDWKIAREMLNSWLGLQSEVAA